MQKQFTSADSPHSQRSDNMQAAVFCGSANTNPHSARVVDKVVWPPLVNKIINLFCSLNCAHLTPCRLRCLSFIYCCTVTIQDVTWNHLCIRNGLYTLFYKHRYCLHPAGVTIVRRRVLPINLRYDLSDFLRAKRATYVLSSNDGSNRNYVAGVQTRHFKLFFSTPSSGLSCNFFLLFGRHI